MKTRLAAFLLALTLFFSTQPGVVLPVSADDELKVEVRNLDVSKLPTVRFLAKVVDQNGRPVANLTAGDLTLKSGDSDIRISSVQSVTDAQVGISSLLVIDTSGSMLGAPISDARQAASQYVQSLQPVDEIAVYSFADNVQVRANYSGDKAGAQRALGGLTARGDTSLYEAITTAARSIGERPAGRRVVIFISDGANVSRSDVTRDQALAAASGAGVPFYVIGLGSSIDRGFLQEVADASGGAFFIAPTSSQLATLFAQVAEVLRSEYVITADVSGSGLQGETSATFSVQAAAGAGKAALNFRLPLIPQPLTPLPEQVAEEGGSNVVLFLLLALLALFVLVGGRVVKRRLTARDAYDYAGSPLPAHLEPPERGAERVSPPREAPPAFLRFETSGEELPVAGLVTLGVDSDCTFQLPISPGEFGQGSLRIWFANQRYLIHDVSARPRVRVNGRAVSWSLLGDGDEIDIRGVKLRFLAPQPQSLG